MYHNLKRPAILCVLSLTLFICKPIWASLDTNIENTSPPQQKVFPKTDKLVLVGEGMLYAIRYPKIIPSSLVISVYITKVRKHQTIGSWVYSQTADTRVFLHDVNSNCFLMFDQQRQIASYHSNSYEIIHDTINNCQQLSKLSLVNVVTIRKCRPMKCKLPFTDLILLKGAAVFEGVAFSDELYFAGEVRIPLMYP